MTLLHYWHSRWSESLNAFIFLLFFNFFLFCDNEKMFKLPSLCLNTSSCWQQQEIPWSAVRWESAIFLESKQCVCQLEIIFCLLGLLVMAWWSHVTASDNSRVGNRKQAEKWVLDFASDNRSLRFLTCCYCYCGENTHHLWIAYETFKAVAQCKREYVGPSKRSSCILIETFLGEKQERHTKELSGCADMWGWRWPHLIPA